MGVPHEGFLPTGMPSCEDWQKIEKATDIPAEEWLLAEFEYRKQQAERACRHAAGES